MGRKKTHSKHELLAKAMDVFREHGFAGTSAEMLVEKIGVSRYSLYSDFGNMQGLFEAALERYNDEIIDLRFGPLERPEAGLDEVLTLLDFYGSAGTGPASGRGCLLCNTAVEFGPNDSTGSGAVQRYFQRLSGAFRNALGNAQEAGRLSADVDTTREADLLTSVVLGLFVMIRAKAPTSTIEHAAESAKERLEAMAT
ncbi:MAG: TetR/AcrR family transcriptional regulator [Paracoccaceae bacterium]